MTKFVGPRALSAGTVSVPRAIIGRGVRASADPKTILTELAASVKGVQSEHKNDVARLNAALEDMAVKMAALKLDGGAGVVSGGFDRLPVDHDYSRTYAAWFRSGAQEHELKAANMVGARQAVHAAMSVGSTSDGGYLAPIEWDRQIIKTLVPLSPLRSIATVIPTTSQAFSTLWQLGGWGSGWVGETAARPNTTTPTLAPLVFPAGEIYANPSVTQRLLDDADFNIESWLANEIAEEFARQESIAFLSGDGVNKPMGLLRYAVGGTAETVHPGGALASANSGHATTVTGDGLIGLVYSLPAPYRPNARWLMNSLTKAAIAKLKDGAGNYLWRESYVAGEPSTLLGYPVTIDEGMPDIAANAFPVAFGDFKRGYVINDRMGVRVLRDPYSNKPYVSFYTTRRVGGGVWDPSAIRLLKIAAA